MYHLSQRISQDQRQILKTSEAFIAQWGEDLALWPEDEIRKAICLGEDIPWLEVERGSVDLTAYRRYQQKCRELDFLPAFNGGIVMHAFMTEPFHGPALRALQSLTHLEVHPIGTSKKALDRVIGEIEESGRAPAELSPSTSPQRPPIREFSSWNYKPSEGVLFVHRVVQEAYLRGASDISIEAKPEMLEIRFKLNGIWQHMPPIREKFATKVLADCKAYFNRVIREDKGYRSGKASQVIGDSEIDLRGEIQKVDGGEAVTIRLLDRTKVVDLARQGLPFPQEESKLFGALIRKKQGFIAVVGPTGSGKTTTLWRCLLSLNSSEKKIMTIEDPVEYRFPSFVQMEVRSEETADPGVIIKETFPLALKSCLRSAPDVILVGEIRDSVTAQTAIRAVLTGHLIFASLHTPNALGLIPRLLDLGVSALDLRQTLLAVVAQRLVPRLCPHCRIPAKVTLSQAKHFEHYGMPVPEKMFTPGACPRCSRGFSGSIPILEFFVPDENAKNMIKEKSEFNDNELKAYWIKSGGRTLARFALEQASAGLIEYDEARALESTLS